MQNNFTYSTTNYHPFGMTMPGRSFTSENYRFGFNGKEDDNEIVGQQDYGFRVYDKRLGRFKSVDPLRKKYPMLSTYQFASNSPIQAIDLDGLEAAVVTSTIGTNSESKDFVINSTIDDKDFIPNPKYGDKGVLYIFTHLDAPEKSSEYYSGAHAEVTPSKGQMLTYRFKKTGQAITDFTKKNDNRYYGAEGFRQLGEDLGEGSTFVKDASIPATTIFGPVTGGAVFKVGAIMDIVGDGILIMSDINDGNDNQAMKRGLVIGGDLLIGHGLEKIGIKDKVRKFATEAAADKVVSEVKDVIIHEPNLDSDE